MSILNGGIGQRPPENRLFAPDDIPGLILWLDSDDPASVITDANDRLVTIQDRSVSGNDLSGESGYEPLMAEDNQSGRTVIRFTAANSEAALLSNDINFVGKTIFWVSRRSGSQSQQNVFSHPTVNLSVRYFSDPTIMLFAGTDDVGAPNVGGPIGFNDVMDRMSLFYAVIGSNQSQIFLNDTAGAAVSHTDTDYPVGQIGRFRAAGGGGENPLEGDFGECLIYDRTDLNPKEIALIKKYLAEKWLTHQAVVNSAGAGDYTTINSALSDFAYQGQYKPAMIKLSDEIYSEVDLLKPAYVTLKGMSQSGSIIEGFQPDTANSTDISNNSPLDMPRPGFMRDLTIRGRNIRYGVHMEAAGTALSSHDLFVIENCTIEHLGNPSPNNTWSGQWAIGAGSGDGSIHIVRNCTLKSKNAGCFSIHDNFDYSRKNRIIIENCDLSTVSGGKLTPLLRASSIGSGQYDMPFIVRNINDGAPLLMDLENLFAITDPAKLFGTQNSYKIDIYDSSVLVLPNDSASGRRFRAEVLVIEDALPDRMPPTLSGDIIPLLMDSDFGVHERETGGGGLKARVLGTFNVSEANLGLSMDTNHHALGKRLGDCRIEQKTLTVGFNQGNDPVTVTFDQDFSLMSNADILSFINTGLGATGTSYTENLDNDIWRAVTAHADEQIIENNGLQGFTPGEAVVNDLGIWRKAIGGDKKIDGIVLSRMAPGEAGRIKTKGYIHQDHLSFTGASISEDDTLMIDTAQAGRLAVGSGPAVMSGWADKAAVFNLD